jgi:hypothetical protein
MTFLFALRSSNVIDGISRTLLKTVNANFRSLIKVVSTLHFPTPGLYLVDATRTASCAGGLTTALALAFPRFRKIM